VHGGAWHKVHGVPGVHGEVREVHGVHDVHGMCMKCMPKPGRDPDVRELALPACEVETSNPAPPVNGETHPTPRPDGVLHDLIFPLLCRSIQSPVGHQMRCPSATASCTIHTPQFPHQSKATDDPILLTHFGGASFHTSCPIQYSSIYISASRMLDRPSF
jgi:hypothetical protein